MHTGALRLDRSDVGTLMKLSTDALEIHAVLVAFRRPEGLRRAAHSLVEQTRRPDRLYVFDNAPTGEGGATAAWLRTHGLDVEYVAADHNVGPAGAAAHVMDTVAATAGDDAWVMVLNDDMTFKRPTVIADLERFALDTLRSSERLAGVGIIGHRIDWLRGRLRRLSNEQLVGAVDVDYLATGYSPMFRVSAIRDAGPMREELFIGMTEVEFGLRLKRAGYELKASADLWSPTPRPERLARGPRTTLARPTWRRYYSVRNFIVILRDNGHGVVAARISLTRGLLKPLLNLAVSPRDAWAHLTLNLAAVRDAWTGTLGRTLEPPDVYEKAGT